MSRQKYTGGFMPYTNSLDELQRTLVNHNDLCLFLNTDINIYSFISELDKNQRIDIIKPIETFLKGKAFCQYDALERRLNTVYYIVSAMTEFESLNYIFEMNEQIRNGNVDQATIRVIEEDKIKMIIFMKENFMFLYRYNTSKLFGQGWRARFSNEKAVVEKSNNGLLILSKNIPDIIIDVQGRVAFLMNISQAEYILEIEDLFSVTLNTFSQNLRDFNLMSADTIDNFIERIRLNKSHMRKLHKIQTTGTYEYFVQNINRIPEVIEAYDLNVNFDQENGCVIFSEESSVSDILHLLADDYIIRYISERNDVMN